MQQNNFYFYSQNYNSWYWPILVFLFACILFFISGSMPSSAPQLLRWWWRCWRRCVLSAAATVAWLRSVVVATDTILCLSLSWQLDGIGWLGTRYGCGGIVTRPDDMTGGGGGGGSIDCDIVAVVVVDTAARVAGFNERKLERESFSWLLRLVRLKLPTLDVDSCRDVRLRCDRPFRVSCS